MSIFNFDLSDLLDKAFDWIIKMYFSSIAELFSYIGTIGSETLDLPWVSAFVTLCKYIGWGCSLPVLLLPCSTSLLSISPAEQM